MSEPENKLNPSSQAQPKVYRPDAVPEASTVPAQSGRGAGAVPEEVGGPEGLEPTRYGDWERKGRCIDF